MVDRVERQTGQGTIWPDGVYFTPMEFEAYIRDEKPTGVHLAFDTQEEFDYLIDHLCPMVQALYICSKHNRAFDLSPLERCAQLESIELYWNTKQEALWDVKKNKKLKHFMEFLNLNSENTSKKQLDQKELQVQDYFKS